MTLMLSLECGNWENDSILVGFKVLPISIEQRQILMI